MPKGSLQNPFSSKQTRIGVFLDDMNLVVPRTELVNLIQPFASSRTAGKSGRPSFPADAMLRVHFLPHWFGLSDTAMEDGHGTLMQRPKA